MQSKLDHVLSGPFPTPQTQFGNTILHVATACKEGEQQQTNFWTKESAGSANHLSMDNSFLLQYQQSYITCEPDGRYTAKFPWKFDHAPLPTNHAICVKRT